MKSIFVTIQKILNPSRKAIVIAFALLILTHTISNAFYTLPEAQKQLDQEAEQVRIDRGLPDPRVAGWLDESAQRGTEWVLNQLFDPNNPNDVAKVERLGEAASVVYLAGQWTEVDEVAKRMLNTPGGIIIGCMFAEADEAGEGGCTDKIRGGLADVVGNILGYIPATTNSIIYGNDCMIKYAKGYNPLEDPCTGADLQNSLAGKSFELSYTVMKNPPDMEVADYVHDTLADNILNPSPAFAQSPTNTGLDNFFVGSFSIFQTFRNFAYFVIILYMIYIGYKIMKGESGFTVQKAIPAIFIVLIGITFSYILAGFIFNIVTALGDVMLNFFGETLTNPKTGEVMDNFDNVGLWSLLKAFYLPVFEASISGMLGSFMSLEKAAFNYIPNLVSSIMASILGIYVVIATFKLLIVIFRNYFTIYTKTAFAPLYMLEGLQKPDKAGAVFIDWVKSIAGAVALLPIILLYLHVARFIIIALLNTDPGFNFIPTGSSFGPEVSLSAKAINFFVPARVFAMFLALGFLKGVTEIPGAVATIFSLRPGFFEKRVPTIDDWKKATQESKTAVADYGGRSVMKFGQNMATPGVDAKSGDQNSRFKTAFGGLMTDALGKIEKQGETGKAISRGLTRFKPVQDSVESSQKRQAAAASQQKLDSQERRKAGQFSVMGVPLTPKLPGLIAEKSKTIASLEKKAKEDAENSETSHKAAKVAIEDRLKAAWKRNNPLKDPTQMGGDVTEGARVNEAIVADAYLDYLANKIYDDNVAAGTPISASKAFAQAKAQLLKSNLNGSAPKVASITSNPVALKAMKDYVKKNFGSKYEFTDTAWTNPTDKWGGTVPTITLTDSEVQKIKDYRKKAESVLADYRRAKTDSSDAAGSITSLKTTRDALLSGFGSTPLSQIPAEDQQKLNDINAQIDALIRRVEIADNHKKLAEKSWQDDFVPTGLARPLDDTYLPKKPTELDPNSPYFEFDLSKSL